MKLCFQLTFTKSVIYSSHDRQDINFNLLCSLMCQMKILDPNLLNIKVV